MPQAVKEILRTLHRDGWQEVTKRTKWSHMQLKHPAKPGKVTFPNHSGDIPAGTLKSILNHLISGYIQYIQYRQSSFETV